MICSHGECLPADRPVVQQGAGEPEREGRREQVREVFQAGGAQHVFHAGAPCGDGDVPDHGVHFGRKREHLDRLGRAVLGVGLRAALQQPVLH